MFKKKITVPYFLQHIRPAYDYANDLLSSIIVDTTPNHGNHLFDVNCKICSGKVHSVDPPSKLAANDAYQGLPADSKQQQHFAGFYMQVHSSCLMPWREK